MFFVSVWQNNFVKWFICGFVCCCVGWFGGWQVCGLVGCVGWGVAGGLVVGVLVCQKQ